MNISKKVWTNPYYFLAFGFGSGLMPIAPGTFGTLAAIPIYILLSFLPTEVYFFITGLFFILGIWICDKVSQQLGVHDFSGIVWDEIVGYLVTMAFAPRHVVWIIVGFLLFRLFDILKPQPIKWVDQRVKGGLGIMLDDLLAAIPSLLLLQLLVTFFKG